MSTSKCNILTIAPYNIIPVKSGGQAAIVSLHHAIGKISNDHIAGAINNDDHDYSFITHKFFSQKPNKYIPYHNINRLTQLAKDNDITHIICEHPYMAINAMTVAKRLNIPRYIRSHNIESERFRALGKPWWWLLKKYEQYAMKKADGIFFITPEDAAWAIKNFGIPTHKCHDIPFGTPRNSAPANNSNTKENLNQQLGIDSSVPWLYFLGALDYPPNTEAVSYILNNITPRLKDSKFEILIGGKGLPEHLQQRIASEKRVHYLGFVNDLDLLLNACDIMLNPVLKGGGIKTKAVEALAYNNTVVSTISGAAGLQKNVCGEKLLLSTDNNWDEFATNTINAMNTNTSIPNSFYETYYNGNIAKRVLETLEQKNG